jgi:hypothetical protein
MACSKQEMPMAKYTALNACRQHDDENSAARQEDDITVLTLNLRERQETKIIDC